MKSVNLIYAILLGVTIGAAGTCCRTVMQTLQEVAGSNNDAGKISFPGTLAAVMTPENRAGFQVVNVQDPNGKTRIAQVRYVQGLTGNAATSETNFCTPAATESESFANMNINYYREVKLTLNDTEFKTFCATQSEFRNEIVPMKLNQLYAGINTDIVTEIAANFGHHYNKGNAAVDLPLINADGTANVFGESLALTSFEDIEAQGRPFLIGTGWLRHYARMLDIGCCNDGGQDLGQAGEFSFYRDKAPDSVIGSSNNIIGFVPGAVQLVPVVDYVGEMRKIDNYWAKMAMTDPRFGIPLDFTTDYSHCEGNGTESSWTLRWRLNFGVFMLPSDLHPAGVFNGVNNTLAFKAVCGDTDVCDNVS